MLRPFQNYLRMSVVGKGASAIKSAPADNVTLLETAIGVSAFPVPIFGPLKREAERQAASLSAKADLR